MAIGFKLSWMAMAAPLIVAAQINVIGVSTTTTQAVLQYTSPVEGICTLQVADMNRDIGIASGVQASGQVTIQTSSPHGLLTGAVIYIENSDMAAWNGWQTITSVPTTASFTFANAAAGTATVGNVGVLVDDVNPALFAGANQDSRPGNITTGARGSGRGRSFVIGLRYAQIAADGNRYSRALQANARHHYTLTCGGQSFDQEFQTQNIPLGDTHNDGPLADPMNPGQYAYPTIQWSNQGQSLIDPVSGLRSIRATAPLGTASLVQTFVTAIDLQSAWQNPAAPLNNFGGAAMFTGPCPSGTCPLFLRADNLSLPGGATYTSVGNSLDWFTVTLSQASTSNPACVGDDCKIAACLTVNGQTCASATVYASLTGTPANYTFGSGALMDLWQGSGSPGISRVDASQATGTVNYVAATQKATLASGNPFNVRWTAGSEITIAGGEYTIASVQSELQLTLATGPTSNLSGVSYSANNFGVLLWKKTGSADRLSIGYTTYRYGSSENQSWSAAATNGCSPNVTAFGKSGYHCLIGNELFWLAADGSIANDLGLSTTSYDPIRWNSVLCGQNTIAYNFDPLDGNTWYCAMGVYHSSQLSIVKVQYSGANTPFEPGAPIPDCSLNRGVRPCLTFTIMQPNPADDPRVAGPLFNPDYAASGFAALYPVLYWQFGGVSPDGDLEMYVNSGQDWPTWMFLYTLGDRTPTGTDAGSMQLVAAASTYRKAPLSWCVGHNEEAPAGGWTKFSPNSMLYDGAAGTYNVTLTSAHLNQTVGAAGGLNACPTNTFGVTGNICTAITINGPPVRLSDGGFLQNIGLGDLLLLDSEKMRVIAMASPTSLTVQRGYGGSPASHSNTIFSMACGVLGYGLWNYRSDPYGTNSSGTTLMDDVAAEFDGHGYVGGGVPETPVTIAVVNYYSFTDPTLCPAASQVCDQTRLGYMNAALNSPQSAVGINPPFAGIVGGIGIPNSVDTHPGPCFNGWCMDGRPFDGNDGSAITLGSPSVPFINVTGQLWKISGASSQLNRKFFTTVAYVGRTPLVDVSGPSSVIGSTAAGSYTYCYAVAAGECVAGSAIGDVYVNAPYVSYPYCEYPGIAVQHDDTNLICIGDLGAYTANLAQLGYTAHDLVGAGIRRLGPNYSRWNQFDVYWNSQATSSGGGLATRVRWLDGVRYDDLVTRLPPYPASDGVARNSFLPVPVTIDPPAALRVQSAIVEFGYAENGNPNSYYCTSRQETCVAASAAIKPATPFYFQQTDSYVGVPCATGCTITVPALSQRVLYYRWQYLNSSGQVVGSSQNNVVITP